MTDITTPDPPVPPDPEAAGSGQGKGPNLADALRRHWLILVAVALLLFCFAAILTLSDSLTQSEALADQQAGEIDDLDAEVLTMSAEIDELQGDLRRSESSLSVARSARAEAEDRAEACEALPDDVAEVLNWMADYMDWIELSQSNIYAAVAQGDAMLAEQKRVLDQLSVSLTPCTLASGGSS